ncbi:MAG: hypothetical protein HN515_06815 [Candidatus Marinimicrobia bacterium]|nr:hypothetical protein [Candidatus Neomarinimicrobiota bacterium]MBT4370756.1 hypothetical protein [Candidatus Neomarinimicrobiota bacterium]MBT5758958.1 hypothetical protein [Candidatus Neomarinimicrobiota bacterium]MBT6516244.1 hypothetical protein [Candidatus Neomarinimicrobiota bacterium]
MKKQTFSIRFGIIILLIAFIHAQENRGALVGAWEFKSMTTIHYSEPKQVEIIYSGENYNETLIFDQDSSFTYKGVSNGEQDNDTGSLSTENNQLIIDLKNVKTISKYKIQDDVLTIIIHDMETEENHAFDTVLEYKKSN